MEPSRDKVVRRGEWMLVSREPPIGRRNLHRKDELFLVVRMGVSLRNDTYFVNAGSWLQNKCFVVSLEKAAMWLEIDRDRYG